MGFRALKSGSDSADETLVLRPGPATHLASAQGLTMAVL